jgi:sterol desaturase/sphingolipid hydroxylase (fatty acid hydroxylase superfamily)
MDKILLYTIPIYLVAIIVEYFFIQKKIPQTYQTKDTLSSIAMGSGFLILSGLSNLFVIRIFIFLNEYSFFNIPRAWSGIFSGEKTVWWVFILLLFLDDFCYYWFHRISHKCRFFWCAHETHHSSEYYNFGTALRQSWIGSPITWIFWAPLSILGFHPEDILFQSSLNLFYQFWIHTKFTKSLGIFDYVMNTPSHHRVHHGTNIPYLDRNYAGVFIIWDRIFKTFTPETKEPRYGVLHPLNSYNPIIIGFHMIKELNHDLKRSNKWKDKIRYLFYPPGWNHEGTGKTSFDLQKDDKNRS